MPILIVFQYQNVMESKIDMSLMWTSIKNVLLVVMSVNQYVLMISLVNLLSLSQIKVFLYDLTNSMIEGNKHCTDIMKKHFNKEFVMTKEDDKDFENSTKC